MLKKQHTAYGIVGLVVGVIGGIAGTAFSMGEDNQRINSTLVLHSSEMVSLRAEDTAHEKATQKELDRLATIISAQMTVLQSGLNELNSTVGGLRTDVQVLKVLMERMENDFKTKTGSD